MGRQPAGPKLSADQCRHRRPVVKGHGAERRHAALNLRAERCRRRCPAMAVRQARCQPADPNLSVDQCRHRRPAMTVREARRRAGVRVVPQAPPASVHQESRRLRREVAALAPKRRQRSAARRQGLRWAARQTGASRIKVYPYNACRGFSIPAIQWHLWLVASRILARYAIFGVKRY